MLNLHHFEIPTVDSGFFFGNESIQHMARPAAPNPCNNNKKENKDNKVNDCLNNKSL